MVFRGHKGQIAGGSPGVSVGLVIHFSSWDNSFLHAFITKPNQFPTTNTIKAKVAFIPEIQGYFNNEHLQYQQTKEEKSYDHLNQSRERIDKIQTFYLITTTKPFSILGIQGNFHNLIEKHL